MSDIEKFIEERSKIPIPSGDSRWVKLLAKELAIGVMRNLWSPNGILNFFHGDAKAWDTNPECYFSRRWRDHELLHLLEVLLSQGYMIRTDGKSPQLTPKAFDLLDETEPYNIFISYKRSESSALALLVLARLKEHGLVPFVDMALEAGGNWHADLEERIESSDYFIILLGKDTLCSDMTIKEITWALQYNRAIIPIWHSGFDIGDKKWAQVEDKAKVVIERTNAIIVQDESASGYNTAIVQLLNRFGITP